MISVEHWAEIRRLHKVENLSKRAIARRLGIHRNTVTRALAEDEPRNTNASLGARFLIPTSQRHTPYWPKIRT